MVIYDVIVKGGMIELSFILSLSLQQSLGFDTATLFFFPFAQSSHTPWAMSLKWVLVKEIYLNSVTKPSATMNILPAFRMFPTLSSFELVLF